MFVYYTIELYVQYICWNYWFYTRIMQFMHILISRILDGTRWYQFCGNRHFIHITYCRFLWVVVYSLSSYSCYYFYSIFCLYISYILLFYTLYSHFPQLRARNCLLFRYTWRNPGFSGVCIAQSLVFVQCFMDHVVPFFILPSRDGSHYVIGYGGRAGGRPHRFPHNNFSSVYRISTKFGHMIPLWKGKNLLILGSLGQRSRSPLL